jgi:hypothetical protein
MEKGWERLPDDLSGRPERLSRGLLELHGRGSACPFAPEKNRNPARREGFLSD